MGDRIKRPNDQIKRPNDQIKRPDDQIKRPNDQIKRPDDQIKRPDDQIKRPNGQKENLEELVLQAVRNNPNITFKVMANELGISCKTVQRIINQLKKSGRVVRKGAGKNGLWEILDRKDEKRSDR